MLYNRAFPFIKPTVLACKLNYKVYFRYLQTIKIVHEYLQNIFKFTTSTYFVGWKKFIILSTPLINCRIDRWRTNSTFYFNMSSQLKYNFHSTSLCEIL